MRLRHYQLIPYLPKGQLLAQWRELNSIFKKQDNHILINYIYKYPVADLYTYTAKVIREMKIRKYRITSLLNCYAYFNINPYTALEIVEQPFKYHHNKRYMLQCFYNLQEKYDRGQKDFSLEEYLKLEKFVKEACYE